MILTEPDTLNKNPDTNSFEACKLFAPYCSFVLQKCYLLPSSGNNLPTGALVCKTAETAVSSTTFKPLQNVSVR